MTNEQKQLDLLKLVFKYPENESEPLIKRISVQEVVDAFKEKYIKEFGKMDDRAYFMSGILIETLNELFEIK